MTGEEFWTRVCFGAGATTGIDGSRLGSGTNIVDSTASICSDDSDSTSVGLVGFDSDTSVASNCGDVSNGSGASLKFYTSSDSGVEVLAFVATG
jgi:hypothetical protein